MNFRAFTGQRYEVRIDGHGGGAFHASVSGGGANGQVVTEGAGVSTVQMKHLGGVKIEPLKFDVALAAARPLLAWMRSSWRGELETRSGALTLADADFNEHTEHWFTNAMITELAFPELDQNTFQSPSLSVTMLPQETGLRRTPSRSMIIGEQPSDLKMWSSSKFRFELDGFRNSNRVFKVGGFSIKQSVEQFKYGSGRFAELCASGLTCDDLTIYIPIAFGQQFQEWYDRVVMSGARDTSEQYQGAITFMGHDNRDLLEIEMCNVGIHDCRQENIKTGTGTVAAFKVVLHVESYKF